VVVNAMGKYWKNVNEDNDDKNNFQSLSKFAPCFCCRLVGLFIYLAQKRA